MSWKAVEMQVALPRTQDAGKIQEQLQQRNQHMQEFVGRDQLSVDEMKRMTVHESDTVSFVNNKKKQNQGTGTSEVTMHDKQMKSKLAHPFLGNKVDLNG